MEYAKIILSAYPNLDRVIKAENENYLRRCFNSAYFTDPAKSFVEDLLSMLDDRMKLICLKRKLDVLFSRLSEEEKQLIFFKYAGIPPKDKFDFSMRTYFRKQQRLQKKVEKFLSYLGITEDVFIREYLKLNYFSIMADVVCSVKRKRNKSSVASTVAPMIGRGDSGAYKTTRIYIKNNNNFEQNYSSS